jgi:hypothetical protein
VAHKKILPDQTASAFRMTETPPPADPDSTLAPDSPPISAQPALPVGTVRGKRLARRKQLAALRNACFNMVSAGYTYAQIAESFGLPERTLRRHVAPPSTSAASKRRTATSTCKLTG